MKNIILCGFKNCGKTSSGKVLATFLQREFVDTDHVLEAMYSFRNLSAKLPCRKIYETLGETQFRRLEEDVIASLGGAENTVIATGGGVCLSEENVEKLKQKGTFIYLYTEQGTLRSRLPSQLPTVYQNFEELYSYRHPIYESVADIIYQTKEKSPTEIAEGILNVLGVHAHG